MFEYWQAPDRDSPQVHPEINFQVSEALQCLLEMEGADGHSEAAVQEVTGKRVSRPRRWHKMFERMGLLFRDGTETRLTPLGQQLRDMKHGVSLREFASHAIETLSRYQLKNPVDDPNGEYPDGTDVNPYWAVWKAMVELDGKLHWDELNRELMRVLRRDQIDVAIERIRNARADTNYDPVRGGGDNVRLNDRCFDREEATEGRDLDGQVRDQITTPWFKRAGFGELLLMSPGREGGGYWSIRPDYRNLLAECIGRGAPSWQSIQDKDDWFAYLSEGIGELSIETEPITGLADQFIRSAEDNGLRFQKDLVVRVVASLCSKRFLILTGLSGSGKTKVAQALARWLTPDPGFVVPGDPSSGKATSCFYGVVPVGADWVGNESVLGYADGLDRSKYISKPAIEIILHASDPRYRDIPHFLILDEMNLSHVERYFADILSAIESGEKIPLYRGPERVSGGTKVCPDLDLPENLFIIGTVNVDETTYMFSPKVLDRAHVVEFRMDVGDLSSYLGSIGVPSVSGLDGLGAGKGKGFLEAAQGEWEVPGPMKVSFDAEMLLFFRAMQADGSEFGYRVTFEAARFISYYQRFSETNVDAALFRASFDRIIAQKLLPKLHGSRAKLGPLLKTLWHLCVATHDVSAPDSAERDRKIGEVLKAAQEAARSSENTGDPSLPISVSAPDAPYPLSAEKIARMWRLLRDNGFTSFAEA